MLADLIVLGEDPLAVAAADIASVPVVRTFVNGEMVFGS
jgi:predicted amidohydrolase YtcJ